MPYQLAAYNGDTVAVPQIVFTHLAQADGDTVRTALYVLQTGDTDPRTIARALGLNSVEAARRALQYWAGAGLLEGSRRAVPAALPEEKAAPFAGRIVELSAGACQAVELGESFQAVPVQGQASKK